MSLLFSFCSQFFCSVLEKCESLWTFWLKICTPSFPLYWKGDQFIVLSSFSLSLAFSRLSLPPANIHKLTASTRLGNEHEVQYVYSVEADRVMIASARATFGDILRTRGSMHTVDMSADTHN